MRSIRSVARSGTRFDFKGVTVELEQSKDELTLLTDDEHRAAAIKDLIESKAIRREPVAEDLRLGQGGGGGRQQGPPEDRPAQGLARGCRQADHEARS